MTYLSITFPEDLKVALDKEAKRQHTKRSTLIQKAVRVYLELKKRQETQNLLRDGYQEMYGTFRQTTDEFSFLDQDALKHVD